MSLSDYRTAVVTGASSGIGAAVAAGLARRGLRVHAAARRKDRLEALARETGCVVHPMDVRDTAALYREFDGRIVDVVVNNAGLGKGFAALHTVAPEDIDTSVDTNVRAVYHLLRAVLPGMVERRRGHVVNIGSMAGLYALQSSVYGGTKAAVHMLSRNLRLELEGTGVRVTEICPGRVNTEFYDVAIDDPRQRSRIKDSGVRELQPEDVAAAVFYALDAPWHVNVNSIELQPVEQIYGGSRFTPVR
ncbi:MAG: SDR family oxidoreductase [Desulfobacteraceae bacterium]|nr:SDR family oxidoreductase [Desulfobacteraceae bacterium]